MKLIGTKQGESPDDTIIRCANNLAKAVLAAGYSLHSTSGVSLVEVYFFDHMPGEIKIENILSGWEVRGKTPLKITFATHKNELIQDDEAEGE